MVTTKYMNQPLGMGQGVGVTQPKMWIVSALSAAGGLAASLFGGSAAASAMREAQRKQAQMEAKENAWYNRRYNEDYLDTAAGQNLVRRARNVYDRNIRRAEGAKAVAGGTDAAVAQAKEQANAALGDTIANIAANDTARKTQVDNIHQQNQQKFAQQQMALDQQRAANITNAAQNASNAILQAGSAVEQMSAAKPNLNGAGNNSNVVADTNQVSGSTLTDIGTTGFKDPIDEAKMRIAGNLG